MTVDGEPGFRAAIGADGSLGLGDGSRVEPLASLYAGGPGVAAVPHDQTLRTGHGPSSARPSAAAVGPGATFYDTTLGRPHWSTGVVWTDAQGAPV